MSKTKIMRAVYLLLMLMLLCSSVIALVGCGKKDKEYVAAMKIICKAVDCGEPTDVMVEWKTTGDVLGEWIFTPDINEMYIEREYDGKQYTYFLSEYESESYLYEYQHWQTCIETHTALIKEGEPADNNRDRVCEKGEYTLIVYAFPTLDDDYYKPRLLRLHISVK